MFGLALGTDNIHHVLPVSDRASTAHAVSSARVSHNSATIPESSRCTQLVALNTTATCLTENEESKKAEANIAGKTVVPSTAPTHDDAKKLDRTAGEDLGVKQVVDCGRKCPDLKGNQIINHIEQTRAYISDVVMNEENDSKYSNHVRTKCRNQDEWCTVFALRGECTKLPSYMLTYCAPSCFSCEMLDMKKRCPKPSAEEESTMNALPNAGVLNRLFERIVTDPWYTQYEPAILSSPVHDTTRTPSVTTLDSQENEYVPDSADEKDSQNHDQPWLILLDNALTDEEADHMLQVGYNQGFERSATTGQVSEDGTFDIRVRNTARTSSTAWCFDDRCLRDPVVQNVMSRIQNITGISQNNAEPFQFLRYEKDQYFNIHNDYLHEHANMPAGVRVLTMFFYFNDVEEGGETYFPHLNLTVKPKKGRAVLWSSVLDQNPNEQDHRTNHAALPVSKGIKHAANVWIHQRDYQTPFARGCR